MIQFFGLDREFENHKSEFLARIESVCSSGAMLQGKETKKLEEECRKITERKFAIAVNSCTDALSFSLLAAGIGPGDRVMVTSYSFIASASAILRVGASPLFLDIDPVNYMMNFEELEKKYNPTVKAVVGVHLFGQMYNISELAVWCKQKNIILVEDAAQAFAAHYDGIPAGAMGDFSCFSFDPTKVLGAYGSGGMVLTNNKKYADRIKGFRYHGKNENGDYADLGFNSQIPEIQAAILNEKFLNISKDRCRRKEIAQIYQQKLKNLSTILLPQECANSDHVWHKFVMRAQNRSALTNYLQSKGVETRIHYSRPMFLEPLFYGYTEMAKEAWPNAISASENVISLPIYPELKEEEVIYIADRVQEFYRNYL